MSFRAFYLTSDGTLQRDLDEAAVQHAFQSRQGLLWVDVIAAKEEDGHVLSQTFRFHPLPVEDAVSPRVNAPKIDNFGDYLFIIGHGIDYQQAAEVVSTTELGVFLGPTFVVSVHNVPLVSVESVAKMVDADEQLMRHGSDLLAHALLDALVDDVFPTLERMRDFADEIQEEAIRNPREATIEAVLALKRSTQRVARAMEPQRNVLDRLSHGEFTLIRPESRIFYRDVYDHLVRVLDSTHSLRERSDTIVTTYLTALNLRQNEVMKVLSIVAAIFLPLSFVAGVYGMNFRHMPELGWWWGYYATLALMAAIALVLLWWFWSKGWITLGRAPARRRRFFLVDPRRLVPYRRHNHRRNGNGRGGTPQTGPSRREI